MKKVLKGFLCGVLALSLFGCGDNSNLSTKASQGEDYSDIFTDKEKKSGFYKNSFIAYNFSLDTLGTTKVYVDTSEGHKFELVADEGGFNIVDKKGDVVIYARAINDNAYQDFMDHADLDETINGREFKCMMTNNGKIDAITNLADVGIDIGFAMEAPSGKASDFSLVAFRGDPVESTKKETKKETVVTEKKSESKKGSLTNSTLSKDVQEKLDSLDTDYAKVNWGVQYSFGDDYPGMVVSVTPAFNGFSHYLIVALTNLYDKPMDVSGSAQAKNKADDVIGETFIYESSIGPGNTVINIINCDDQPDGRIHWEDVKIKEGYATYIPWEADYAVTGKKGEGKVSADYEIYSADKKTDLENVTLCALLLDDEGFVIGYGMDYLSDTIKAGSKGKSSAVIYADDAVLAYAKDVALFANSIKF